MANYSISTITMGDDAFDLQDHRNAGVYYGTCATGASTQTKVVTCANYTLAEGAIIFVKFASSQTYNGAAKLNVNSTGAITVKNYGTTDSLRYCWYAGEVVGFVYDGTNYVMLEGGLATTSYYGVVKLVNSTTSTSTDTAAVPASVKSAYDLAATKSKVSYVTATLNASSWSNGTNTVSVVGVTSSNNGSVGLAPTTTSTQYAAAAAAKMLVTAQGTGTITVTAFGTVPTVNIPIVVEVVS